MSNYTIKPLEWEYRKEGWTDVDYKYCAYNGFASFELCKYFNDDEWLICYSLKGDRGYKNGNSLEECKSICEELWKNELEEVLIKEN